MPARKTRTTRQKTPKAQRTEQGLIDAAEALFAEREFDSVSTRDIATRAKVNLALVHYYFGSKEKLLRRVLSRRVEELSRRRLELLEARRKPARPIPLDEIAEAFVLPLLEFATAGDRGWKNYIRLNGRVASSQKYLKMAGNLYDPVARIFIDEIARTLVGASRRDIEWGFLFMVSAMSGAFGSVGRIERLSEGQGKSSELDKAYGVLIPFIVAGLAAIGTSGRGTHPSVPAGRKISQLTN
jgi:AcrR family transcriptional regulator